MKSQIESNEKNINEKIETFNSELSALQEEIAKLIQKSSIEVKKNDPKLSLKLNELIKLKEDLTLSLENLNILEKKFLQNKQKISNLEQEKVNTKNEIQKNENNLNVLEQSKCHACMRVFKSGESQDLDKMIDEVKALLLKKQ